MQLQVLQGASRFAESDACAGGLQVDTDTPVDKMGNLLQQLMLVSHCLGTANTCHQLCQCPAPKPCTVSMFLPGLRTMP